MVSFIFKETNRRRNPSDDCIYAFEISPPKRTESITMIGFFVMLISTIVMRHWLRNYTNYFKLFAGVVV